MDTFIIILIVVAFICIAVTFWHIIQCLDVLFAKDKIQNIQNEMFREMSKSQDRIDKYYGERITALELQMESFKNKDEKNDPTDK